MRRPSYIQVKGEEWRELDGRILFYNDWKKEKIRKTSEQSGVGRTHPIWD